MGEGWASGLCGVSVATRFGAKRKLSGASVEDD
jgi:hypothetical protein